MDKKLHLANTNERSKKIYKLKSISEKQSKFKKKEENNTYTVQPQKSSSEKAKQSETQPNTQTQFTSMNKPEMKELLK